MVTAIGLPSWWLWWFVRRRGRVEPALRAPAPPPARIAGSGTRSSGSVAAAQVWASAGRSMGRGDPPVPTCAGGARCRDRGRGLGARARGRRGGPGRRPDPVAAAARPARAARRHADLHLRALHASSSTRGRSGCAAGSPLAAQARAHARQREALGFAPREIVTEFLLLRRVLWRVRRPAAPAELGPEEVLAVEAASERDGRPARDRVRGRVLRPRDLGARPPGPARPADRAAAPPGVRPRARARAGARDALRPRRSRSSSSTSTASRRSTTRSGHPAGDRVLQRLRHAPARIAARLRSCRTDGRRRVRRVSRRVGRGGRPAAASPA